jgi:hypothetical protein
MVPFSEPYCPGVFEIPAILQYAVDGYTGLQRFGQSSLRWKDSNRQLQFCRPDRNEAVLIVVNRGIGPENADLQVNGAVLYSVHQAMQLIFEYVQSESHTQKVADTNRVT